MKQKQHQIVNAAQNKTVENANKRMNPQNIAKIFTKTERLFVDFSVRYTHIYIYIYVIEIGELPPYKDSCIWFACLLYIVCVSMNIKQSVLCETIKTNSYFAYLVVQTETCPNSKIRSVLLYTHRYDLITIRSSNQTTTKKKHNNKISVEYVMR